MATKVQVNVVKTPVPTPVLSHGIVFMLRNKLYVFLEDDSDYQGILCLSDMTWVIEMTDDTDEIKDWLAGEEYAIVNELGITVIG